MRLLTTVSPTQTSNLYTGNKHLRGLVKSAHGGIDTPSVILAAVTSKICHLASVPALAFQRQHREMSTSLSFLTSLT